MLENTHFVEETPSCKCVTAVLDKLSITDPYKFLTLALSEDEQSASCFDLFVPGETAPCTPCWEVGWVPQLICKWKWKKKILNPVHPVCSMSLQWLSFVVSHYSD